MERVLRRKCVDCGKILKIKVAEDLSYSGGNYFGKFIGKKEYWECDDCYNKPDESSQ